MFTIKRYIGGCNLSVTFSLLFSAELFNLMLKRVIKGVESYDDLIKIGFDVPFNSQVTIGIGHWHCHSWESNPKRSGNLAVIRCPT